MLTTAINRALSRVASSIKGKTYDVDAAFSSGYLISVGLERAFMRVRGRVVFPLRDQALFVGAKAHIRSRRDVRFGSGVTIGPGCYIDAASVHGVTLGDNTSLGRNSRIECTGSLQNIGFGFSAGTNVGLGTDCFYGSAGGITIGDNTIIGNFVSMHSENHIFSSLQRPIRDQGVTRNGIAIGQDCWIGAKVTVLDGTQLGNGCIVAAGSVLTGGTYSDFGVYGGVPARLLKDRKAAP